MYRNSEFLKYYIIFIFIFFQRKKLRQARQPTGQRQLLENKQILPYIRDFLLRDFVKFKNTQLADDMPETQVKRITF